MPELAEVEYYRRQWDPGVGQEILRVQLHAGKRIFRESNPREIVRALAGSRFLRSSSWGKQMLFEFSGGNWIGIHLGMTGTLRIEAPWVRPESMITSPSIRRNAPWSFATPGFLGAFVFTTENLPHPGGALAGPIFIPRLSINVF